MKTELETGVKIITPFCSGPPSKKKNSENQHGKIPLRVSLEYTLETVVSTILTHFLAVQGQG